MKTKKKYEFAEAVKLFEMQITYKSKEVVEKQKVDSSATAAKAFRALYPEGTMEHIERFFCVALNRANKIIGWLPVSVGGVSGTVVDVRVVLQFALMANASGLILCHNHPSGQLSPSRQDIEITQKIQNAAKFHEIQVMDRVILTEESYYSFADEGKI